MPDASPPSKPTGNMDLSDPRVLMAAERTLLAWVRTGLAMMGFGFVVARFGLFLRELAVATGKEIPAGRPNSLWIGVTLVLAGVWVLVVSAIHHRRYTRALTAGQQVAPPSPLLGVAVSIMLAVLGLAMAWYLILIG